MGKRGKKEVSATDLTTAHTEFLKSFFAGKGKSELLDLFVKHLREEHKLSIEDVNRLVGGKEKDILLPISIFDNKKLSALEAITKYLKENKELSFHQIGVILNRNERCIWTTNNNSKKKMKEGFVLKPSRFLIPADIFTNRKLSVLENLVKYMKESLELSLHEIAELLHRDDRTIWTVYSRATRKQKLSGVSNKSETKKK
ncbi:hypothetical protein KY360_05355 [Candidatus Woesearchaeota archaeon]|nr:hypothetical protein [Candidatus Woesearchaeota archaeon]